MIVIVDANIIFSDPHLRAAMWADLVAPIVKGKMSVLVPDVALREAKARHMSERAGVVAELEQVKKRSPKSALAHLDQAIAASRAEIAAYPAALDERIEELGWDVISLSALDHDEFIERAINRKPPFDAKGNGFRDAILWQTALDQIGSQPDDDYVLLSNDARAFVGPDGTLHPDLEEEALVWMEQGGTIVLARSVSEIAIPGRYRSEEVEFRLERELAQYLAAEVVGMGRSEVTAPELLGVGRRVDWAEVEEAEEVVITDFTARRLVAEPYVEVKFTAIGAVLIHVIDLDYDGEGAPIEAGQRLWRRVIFRGTALTDVRVEELRGLSALSIQVDPDRYSPGAVIEAGFHGGSRFGEFVELTQPSTPMTLLWEQPEETEEETQA